jgi:hypothetical protein
MLFVAAVRMEVLRRRCGRGGRKKGMKNILGLRFAKRYDLEEIGAATVLEKCPDHTMKKGKTRKWSQGVHDFFGATKKTRVQV